MSPVKTIALAALIFLIFSVAIGLWRMWVALNRSVPDVDLGSSGEEMGILDSWLP